MDYQHVPFADADLLQRLGIVAQQAVVVHQALCGGGNIRIAFNDGLEDLQGHVPGDIEGDDVGIRLIGIDDAHGDAPA